MNALRSLWNLFAPVFNEFVGGIAHGPWGRAAHQAIIDIYKRIYGIQWADTREFRTLGNFFLRTPPFEFGANELVSPVEADCLLWAEEVSILSRVQIKGLEYRFSEFPELREWPLNSKAYAWNFYLSPKHYHWFHAPCSGRDLKARRVSGSYFPVNSLGRNLCPFLYNANERLSFSWHSDVFGKVVMMCVGAVGVSKIRSELREVPKDEDWMSLKDVLQKGERLGAFELGSSILLLTEKQPPILSPKTYVMVGENLSQ